MFLWSILFKMRLPFNSRLLVKQMTFHNVGGPHLISWRPADCLQTWTATLPWAPAGWLTLWIFDLLSLSIISLSRCVYIYIFLFFLENLVKDLLHYRILFFCSVLFYVGHHFFPETFVFLDILVNLIKLPSLPPDPRTGTHFLLITVPI